MTYAVGQIIYGVDLTELPRGLSIVADIGDVLEDYAETAYSGNGDEPRWFGATMGSIDECTTEDGDSLIQQLTATDEHKTSYAEKLKQLNEDETVDQAIKDYFNEATPRVWLLWGSS